MIPLDGFMLLRARINGVVFTYPGRGCVRFVVDVLKPSSIEHWLCIAKSCGARRWCPCGRVRTAAEAFVYPVLSTVLDMDMSDFDIVMGR